MGVGPQLSIWLLLTVTVGLCFITETRAQSGDGDEEATPTVGVRLGLTEPFTPDLNNPNSAAYMALEMTVVNECTIICANALGNAFDVCLLRRFREVSAVTRESTTAADMAVQLDSSIPVSQLPTADTVANAIVEGAANSSLIDPSSVVITAVSFPTPATTGIPLSFTSVGETFTTDLMDLTTPASMARAILITTTLEPFYNESFPSSFQSMNVTGFRNGSIINDLLMQFSAGNVPNITDIANVLVNASSNITAFNISVSSITVNGTAISVSSGVSHNISLITASFFVLLSWLLSSQH
ncbi:uncharacterized protein [Antennarius striatus]|uniref:uncharacterized protein n=1 Tax=Antennarius striatus TaxID=241820 RepID=UPI0035B34799